MLTLTPRPWCGRVCVRVYVYWRWGVKRWKYPSPLSLFSFAPSLCVRSSIPIPSVPVSRMSALPLSSRTTCPPFLFVLTQPSSFPSCPSCPSVFQSAPFFHSALLLSPPSPPSMASTPGSHCYFLINSFDRVNQKLSLCPWLERSTARSSKRATQTNWGDWAPPSPRRRLKESTERQKWKEKTLRKTTLFEYGTEDCLLTSREGLVEIGKDVWRTVFLACGELVNPGVLRTRRKGLKALKEKKSISVVSANS